MTEFSRLVASMVGARRAPAGGSKHMCDGLDFTRSSNPLVGTQPASTVLRSDAKLVDNVSRFKKSRGVHYDDCRGAGHSQSLTSKSFILTRTASDSNH